MEKIKEQVYRILDTTFSDFKTENDSEVYANYMEACSNGIARNASVVARHNSLGKSFGEFFKTEENSENILTTA